MISNNKGVFTKNFHIGLVDFIPLPDLFQSFLTWLKLSYNYVRLVQMPSKYQPWELLFALQNKI